MQMSLCVYEIRGWFDNFSVRSNEVLKTFFYLVLWYCSTSSVWSRPIRRIGIIFPGIQTVVYKIGHIVSCSGKNQGFAKAFKKSPTPTLDVEFRGSCALTAMSLVYIHLGVDLVSLNIDLFRSNNNLHLQEAPLDQTESLYWRVRRSLGVGFVSLNIDLFRSKTSSARPNRVFVLESSEIPCRVFVVSVDLVSPNKS